MKPSHDDPPSCSPNSSGPPSDEPPQRRREPWTRKEKIAAGAVAATLLTAVPAVIALVPSFAPPAEKSNGRAEASAKPPTEFSPKLITVTNPDNGTTMCVGANTSQGQRGGIIELGECDYSGKTEGQLWTFHPGDTVRVWGKCLDVVENSSEKRARLHLWDCNGVGGQQWRRIGNGTLRNTQSELCLDVPGGKLEKGVDLQTYDCLEGFWTQQWSIKSTV